MLILDGKTDLNQISLTGIRSLAMIGLLVVAPRSLEEIRQHFIDMHIMDNTHSDDILRIDLNTIKAMGCEVSRSSAKTGFKYVLTKHPFSLPVTEQDLNLLRKIYDKIITTTDMPVLMEYHNLFEKLSKYIDNDNIREELLGISIFKYYDSDLIKDLYNDCKNERTLKLIYANPTTRTKEEKEVVAQKLVFKNNKIYLYCYDLGKETPIILKVKNIRKVVSRSLKSVKFEKQTTKVKYFLKNLSTESLLDEETIINAQDNGYLIEGNYYNQFLAMQRILSFGSDCIVKEPEDFKQMIISKLKEMRTIYE